MVSYTFNPVASSVNIFIIPVEEPARVVETAEPDSREACLLFLYITQKSLPKTRYAKTISGLFAHFNDNIIE